MALKVQLFRKQGFRKIKIDRIHRFNDEVICDPKLVGKTNAAIMRALPPDERVTVELIDATANRIVFTWSLPVNGNMLFTKHPRTERLRSALQSATNKGFRSAQRRASCTYQDIVPRQAQSDSEPTAPVKSAQLSTVNRPQPSA